MIKRLMILVATAALALAACSASSGGSDAPTSDDAKDASTTTAASNDGGGSSQCGADDGADGVIRSFCDGPATVTFEIGDTSGEVGGGTCEESGGYFTVNAGTVVGADFDGTQPDYAGILLPPTEGEFSGNDASFTITFDGTPYVVTEASGSYDASGGTFSGTVMYDDTVISGSFTC